VGTVRLGTDRDAGPVAELHMSSISEGFLASLGPSFLRRLYSSITSSPDGFLLVADNDPGRGDRDPAELEAAGFVAGATDIGRLYRRFLLRDGAVAALSSAPRLLRAAPQALETLRYGVREGNVGLKVDGGEVELLSLAVQPARRRAGTGSSLVKAFLCASSASGAQSARVVVGASNENAIKLYRNAGFEPVHSLELHRGTTSLVMRVRLPATVAD
jgi:ribosomal protein S18 acetylase RimI-like enzyme